jgi:rod shape-determining protein MreB
MKNLFSFFGKDIGVDLGTSNSLIYLTGKGVVVNEPSIVAINNKTHQILAVGVEAKKMLGRTPAHIQVIRPLIHGVISDFEMTQEILRQYLKRASGSKMFVNFKKAVIGVPTNLTEVERKSVEDALIGIGVSKAYTIDEPLAAVLGGRLPIDEPAANMIIDIGGGTTEIAMVSMGGTVIAKSLKIAGDKFNSDIIKFIRDEFKMIIGEPTAEEVKLEIGSAIVLDKKLEMPVKGRDLTTGLPKEIIIKDHQVRMAISKSLKSIIEMIREVIEVSPPELAGDILKRGIHLCGGGSLLRGIDRLISEELMINTFILDDPLTCVVRGTGIVVENIDKYKQILNNPLKPRDIKI